MDFWNKNNSEGIVSNSVVPLNQDIRGGCRYPSDRQFFLWHVSYSGRLFVLRDFTWRGAHVTAG